MKTRFIFILLSFLTIAALLAGCSASSGPPGWSVKTKTLVQGAPVHGAEGMRFSPDGKLYIASWVAGEMAVMNPENGKIEKRIGPAQGFTFPHDVAFGPDGTLYIAELFSGVVKKYSPDGAASTLASLEPGYLFSIVSSKDGRLFVGNLYPGTLYEIDPKGVQKPRLIMSIGLWDMDFGPDGLLYGAINGMLVAINVDTGDTPWAVSDSVRTARLDSQGNIYSIDENTAEVIHIEPATKDRKIIAKTTLSTNLGTVRNTLSVDARDRVFVGNHMDGTLAQVQPGGELRAVSPGGLTASTGIGIQPHPEGGESLWIGNLWSLVEFDGRTGNQLSFTPTSKISAEEFLISSVSLDGDNLIGCTDFDWAVQVWDLKTLESLASYGDFAGPPLHAIRFEGDIVVTEGTTGIVIRIKPDERVTLAQLVKPSGLVARGGDLWVSDWAVGKVYQIVAGGQVLTEPKVVASDLAGPQGLAFDNTGGLLVMESGAGRLSRIDMVTGEKIVLADGLGIYALSVDDNPRGFRGVAVSPSGTIYINGGKEETTDAVIQITARRK